MYSCYCCYQSSYRSCLLIERWCLLFVVLSSWSRFHELCVNLLDSTGRQHWTSRNLSHTVTVTIWHSLLEFLADDYRHRRYRTVLELCTLTAHTRCTEKLSWTGESCHFIVLMCLKCIWCEWTVQVPVSFRLSVCPSACLSVCLPVRPSVCPFVCLSCLSSAVACLWTWVRGSLWSRDWLVHGLKSRRVFMCKSMYLLACEVVLDARWLDWFVCVYVSLDMLLYRQNYIAAE